MDSEALEGPEVSGGPAFSRLGGWLWTPTSPLAQVLGSRLASAPENTSQFLAVRVPPPKAVSCARLRQQSPS